MVSWEGRRNGEQDTIYKPLSPPLSPTVGDKECHSVKRKRVRKVNNLQIVHFIHLDKRPNKLEQKNDRFLIDYKIFPFLPPFLVFIVRLKRGKLVGVSTVSSGRIFLVVRGKVL